MVSGFRFHIDSYLSFGFRVLEELRLPEARVADQEAVRLPPRPRPC